MNSKAGNLSRHLILFLNLALQSSSPSIRFSRYEYRLFFIGFYRGHVQCSWLQYRLHSGSKQLFAKLVGLVLQHFAPERTNVPLSASCLIPQPTTSTSTSASPPKTKYDLSNAPSWTNGTSTRGVATTTVIHSKISPVNPSTEKELKMLFGPARPRTPTQQ
jgi:hypothetical protein